MTEKEILLLPAGTLVRVKGHKYFEKNGFLVFQRNDKKDFQNEKNFGVKATYQDGKPVICFDFEAEEIELF